MTSGAPSAAAERLITGDELARMPEADLCELIEEIFTNAAAGYTADELMQERIVKELWRKAGRR